MHKCITILMFPQDPKVIFVDRIAMTISMFFIRYFSSNGYVTLLPKYDNHWRTL